MDCPFPIGSIFITVDSKNPSSIWADTARIPFGKGRTIVCVNDASSAEWLKEPGKLGGNGAWTTKTINTGDEGSATVISEQSTNYQPSITAYVRQRVATTNDYNPFNVDLSEDGGQQLLNPFVIQRRDSSLNTTVPKMPQPYQP